MSRKRTALGQFCHAANYIQATNVLLFNAVKYSLDIQFMR